MDYPWKTEKEFYDLHAKVLFTKYPFYHATMIGKTKEEFTSFITGRLNLKPGDKVVDLGCGSGYLTNELNRICTCIGLSNNEECIRICREAYPDTTFELGNMESFSTEGATHFISLESTGYTDPAKTFKNVYNNLQNGGIFYVKDLLYYYAENEKQKENRLHWESYFKYKTRNVPEFVELGYKAGFRLMEFKDLSEQVNLDMFLDSLKHNVVEFNYPHPGEWCHMGGDFIFQKVEKY